MKLGFIAPAVLLACLPSFNSQAQEYRVEVVMVSLPADFSVEQISELDVDAVQGLDVRVSSSSSAAESSTGPAPAARVLASPRRAASAAAPTVLQSSQSESTDLADVLQQAQADAAAMLAALHQTQTDAAKALRDVTLLSRPVLIVAAGRSAQVTVGSNHSFDYMQPDETAPDRFIKKSTGPKELGFSVTLTVEDAGDGWVMLKQFAASLTSLVRRRAVKGLKLDCGEPVFAAHSITSDFSLRLGKTHALPFPVVSGRMPVVLVRVNRSDQ